MSPGFMALYLIGNFIFSIADMQFLLQLDYVCYILVIQLQALHGSACCEIPYPLDGFVDNYLVVGFLGFVFLKAFLLPYEALEGPCKSLCGEHVRPVRENLNNYLLIVHLVEISSKH